MTKQYGKEASIVFHFASSEEAKIVQESLSPEIKHKIPKTTVEISSSENILSLKIISRDTTALRAACNSYLRWINTAVKVQQII
jgi:tRNA threonylcarbamoyladenosine modification (KEOPS) complex  Pcc1 subunit